MNQVIGVLAIFVGFSAQAAKIVTVKTVVTCQQEEGDYYYDAGVVAAPEGGHRLLVVANSVDENTKTLVANRPVYATKKAGQTVYQDSLNTIRMTVFNEKGHTSTGRLIVLQDGPGTIRQDHLLCYEKSSISFDRK